MINDKTFATTIKEQCNDCSVGNDSKNNNNFKENSNPVNRSMDEKLINDLNKNLKIPITRVGFIQYNKSGYRVKNGYVVELSIISEPCEELFAKICELTHLEKLSLRKTFIKTIPLEIAYLKHILYIDLKNNDMQSIPEELYMLDKLQYLDLSYNSIKSFSALEGFFPKLEVFILDHNYLEKMIFSENSCLKLRECFANHNEIQEIQINYLKSLNYLALQNNQLANIPDIKDLTSLETLELHYNKITDLSTDFSTLKSLKSISLSYNKIKHINFNTILKSKVLYCFIDGNPLNKSTRQKFKLFLKNK